MLCFFAMLDRSELNSKQVAAGANGRPYRIEFRWRRLRPLTVTSNEKQPCGVQTPQGCFR
jgi:hypothetical protein